MLRRVYAAVAFLSTLYFVVALVREVSLMKFLAHLVTAESFLILIVGSVCTLLLRRGA